MLLLHDNASTLRGLTSHFVAYILQFQEIIVYKIHPGVGGSIASLRSIRSKCIKHFISMANPRGKAPLTRQLKREFYNAELLDTDSDVKLWRHLNAWK